MRRVTASSWDADYPPEGVLDTRNENGWSPEVAHDGPAQLTVTFDQADRRGADAVSSTVQLNFGHGRNLVGGQVGDPGDDRHR